MALWVQSVLYGAIARELGVGLSRRFWTDYFPCANAVITYQVQGLTETARHHHHIHYNHHLLHHPNILEPICKMQGYSLGVQVETEGARNAKTRSK
jgi:hypothetical protein